ncbi:MAG: aryl-sulfate sulfotransferase [Chitinispirillaceae bacterium]|nr:aryl-sulfate sulfotransferase [Chitinispirillaceae bacterium]
MKSQKVLALACMASLSFFSFSSVQALTDGYILVGAYSGKETFLIDKNGKTVWQWNHTTLPDSLNGYSSYLLENGHLLRTAQAASNVKVPPNAAPRQGIIDEVDHAGNVVWTYTLANDTFMLHHDMKPLPPRSGETVGNILASTFSLHTKAEMKQAGVDTTILPRGTNVILAEKIIEIKRNFPSGGDIVWEWRMLDHVTPKESASLHPERISGGIVSSLWMGQWVHLNGIDYSPATDLIVFSSRVFSELYVIDHSTTTAEAAGSTGGGYNKGGDILYRWGKPGNYGATGGTTISCLHSPTWVPEGYAGAGNILFYHNNIDSGKSEVIEINPPLDARGNFIKEAGAPFGPQSPFWKYAPDTNFFSAYMSSTMRMPGPQGHTVIHESYPPAPGGSPSGVVPNTDSRIREVSTDGQIIDSFSLTGLNSGSSGMMRGFNPAKIMYYPSSYPGISRLLTSIRERGSGSQAGPLSPMFSVRRTSGSIIFSGVAGDKITLVSPQGKVVVSGTLCGNSFSVSSGRLPPGVYGVKVTKGNEQILLRAVTIVR